MARQSQSVRSARTIAIPSTDARRLAEFCRRHAFDQDQVIERLLTWLVGETKLIRSAIVDFPSQRQLHAQVAQRILHQVIRGQ